MKYSKDCKIDVKNSTTDPWKKQKLCSLVIHAFLWKSDSSPRTSGTRRSKWQKECNVRTTAFFKAERFEIILLKVERSFPHCGKCRSLPSQLFLVRWGKCKNDEVYRWQDLILTCPYFIKKSGSHPVLPRPKAHNIQWGEALVLHACTLLKIGRNRNQKRN